ncbi:hypothetical protein L484_014856 [Morus notabilis]|uniref:DUF7477 domain-containing protein n=1 Tax=Morus notabilis TaxID=981085 RepID=W9SR42_9ROSA|nr:hypothetical protein L484_014856 [Morus notabilis]
MTFGGFMIHVAAVRDRIFTARADVVKALHDGVFFLIGASVAILPLKQQSPFETHYWTMVAFLIVVCIYVVTGLASIKFSGFAEEVTTNVSLLSGLLASLLLFLIMVPALGWACLVSWTLYVVIVTYKMLSSGHPQQQQDNQCHDLENHVPIQNCAKRRKPATQWISVYNFHLDMKQRYHYDVKGSRLSPKIAEGKEDGLFVSSVASCSNLWALIMDEGTGFSDQVYDLSPFFLHDEWIKKRREKDFYITAIAGADDGSSLVVMSKGTQFLNQRYKVNDSFPFQWIKGKREKGYYVTAMATSGRRWAIVVSKGAGFSEQFVEVDSKYPSERIRGRWKSDCFITAAAATVDQAAFVLSVPRTKPDSYKQETYRSSSFPSKCIRENWEKNLYVTTICYGQTIS